LSFTPGRVSENLKQGKKERTRIVPRRCRALHEGNGQKNRRASSLYQKENHQDSGRRITHKCQKKDGNDIQKKSREGGNQSSSKRQYKGGKPQREIHQKGLFNRGRFEKNTGVNQSLFPQRRKNTRKEPRRKEITSSVKNKKESLSTKNGGK